ncbi:RNA polymerase sigma factor [Paenibacillus mangrovi]|uniref:RNA polymerase sigma factor n=1 Tax=Paenibacillus mangrovi TaxID=2931978 RepID=UPI00314027BE
MAYPDRREPLPHETENPLSYIYREVITLHYFQEWSVNEIAEHLNLNSNTVKARLARGRHALRQTLEKEGDIEWIKGSQM